MLVAERRRKLSPTDPEGLHVLVIDELAFYLRGGKKETRERFTELLRDLVSRGRAAGIIVVAATQKPSHEIVPTWIRDLFSFRLALRCTSSDASDTILGQGWAHQGFSAATIDPTLRGVGYLLAEGGTPTLAHDAVSERRGHGRIWPIGHSNCGARHERRRTRKPPSRSGAGRQLLASDQAPRRDGKSRDGRGGGESAASGLQRPSSRRLSRRAPTSTSWTPGFSSPVAWWAVKGYPNSWAPILDSSSRRRLPPLGQCTPSRPMEVAFVGGATSSPWCSHGRLASCSQYHETEDPQLGRPLCVDCFDFEGAVLWNAHASRLWNNTVQGIRRSLAKAGGVVQTNLKNVAQIHYLKVAEVQRRGLDPHPQRDSGRWTRVDRCRSSRVADAGTPLESRPRLHRSGVRAATRWKEPSAGGRSSTFAISALTTDDAKKVASYVAKYSTKTTDGTRDLARRFHSRRQIEELVDNPHFRQLALDRLGPRRPARLRASELFAITPTPLATPVN